MAQQPAFKIQTTADTLCVTSEVSNSAAGKLLSVALILFVICKLAAVFPNSGQLAAFRSPHAHGFSVLDVTFALLFPSLVLLFLLAIVFGLIRSFFPSGESLTCDRTTLTVGKIPEGNFHGKWEYQSFPVSSIKQSHFGVVRVRRSGGGTGLIFDAEDKTLKCLEGLEAPEADQILQALSTLGVDVHRDPAMPMMVEMATSRRNGKFAWFWN